MGKASVVSSMLLECRRRVLCCPKTWRQSRNCVCYFIWERCYFTFVYVYVVDILSCFIINGYLCFFPRNKAGVTVFFVNQTWIWLSIKKWFDQNCRICYFFWKLPQCLSVLLAVNGNCRQYLLPRSNNHEMKYCPTSQTMLFKIRERRNQCATALWNHIRLVGSLIPASMWFCSLYNFRAMHGRMRHVVHNVQMTRQWARKPFVVWDNVNYRHIVMPMPIGIWI